MKVVRSLSLLLAAVLCYSSLQAQIISTIAGSGSATYSGDDGPATAAGIYAPFQLAVRNGEVYITDYYQHRIRKVNSSGIITTIAGNGTSGFSGDGGPASAAVITYPYGITFDAAGNLYFSSSGRIRKINTAGIITTFAGNGIGGFSGDGGPATAAGFNAHSIFIDAAGNVFFSDNYRVRKINTAGIITTIAGNGTFTYSGDGGPATAAGIHVPDGLVTDAAGNVYVGCSSSQRVRKINTAGIISTIAGTGTLGYSGDGGPATAATFSNPEFLTWDNSGNLLISDNGNHCIRKIDASGVVTTIVGTGVMGFSGDGGPASAATFNQINNVVVDPVNNMYILDWHNNRIRLVTYCPLPVAGAISAITSASICTGGTVTLSTTSTGGSWISGAGAIASVNTAGVVTGLSAGNAIITYSVSNSCGTATDTQMVAVNTAPPVPAIIGPYTVCAGAGITLSTTATAGIWSTSLPGIASVDASGAVYGLAPGSSVITYQVSNICGSSSDTQAITVLPLPDAGTITSEGTLCVGGTLPVTPTVPGGSWSSASGTVATIDGSGTIGGAGAGLAVISYTVTNSCGAATDTMQITVNPLPNAGTISGADSVCRWETATITPTVPGGIWVSGNTAVATVSTAGVVTPVTPGTLSIMYVVNNVCGADTAFHNITVRSACPDAVDHFAGAAQVRLLPNPAHAACTITLPAGYNDAVVSLYDISGKVLLQPAHTTSLNLSSIAPGVYMVKIALSDQAIMRRLLVE